MDERTRERIFRIAFENDGRIGRRFRASAKPRVLSSCSRIRIDPRTPREDPLPTEITRALRADNRIIAAQAIFLLGGDESRRVDSAIADISSAPEIFFLSRRAFVKKKKQGEDGRDRSNKSALIERFRKLFFRYVASL